MKKRLLGAFLFSESPESFAFMAFGKQKRECVAFAFSLSK
jgi:hypothetical protein